MEINANSHPNEQIVSSILDKLDTFISMKRVARSSYINGPSSIYLANTIKNLDAEFSHNPDLVHECYGFIDMIKFVSVIYRGDSDIFLSEILTGLVNTRVINDMSKVVADRQIDDYVYADNEDTRNFFATNVAIFSLYIYVLIDTLYGG